MSKSKISEWFWRFLALVMTFSVAWMVWIIYQLNPPPLIMNAAFEAAATAKGKEPQNDKQSAQGVIVPSTGAEPAAKAPEASVAALPEAAKTPPVNPEKLKFSDSIALPVSNPKQ